MSFAAIGVLFVVTAVSAICIFALKAPEGDGHGHHHGHGHGHH